MLVEELLLFDVPKYASQALSKPWFPLPKEDPACNVMVDCQDMVLVHYFDFWLMPSLREERGVEKMKIYSEDFLHLWSHFIPKSHPALVNGC